MLVFLLIAFIVLAFFLIAKGGDNFVDASVRLAEKTKVPKIIIGALIVSIGTTIPEISVSLIAVLNNSNELAVSNATGSMLCNLLLVLGIALTFGSALIKRKDLLYKIIMLGVNAILVLVFILDGKINILEASVLMALFVIFIVINIVEGKKSSKLLLEAPSVEVVNENLFILILEFIVASLTIFVGANVLVTNICILASDYLHISGEILGVTVVAVGTSLPELVTAINSVKKNCISLSIGNVLGANIINGTFLISMCAYLGGGMNVGGLFTIIMSVIGVLLGLVIFALPILIKGKTNKLQGVLMLGLYVLYLIYLVLSVIL